MCCYRISVLYFFCYRRKDVIFLYLFLCCNWAFTLLHHSWQLTNSRHSAVFRVVGTVGLVTEVGWGCLGCNCSTNDTQKIRVLELLALAAAGTWTWQLSNSFNLSLAEFPPTFRAGCEISQALRIRMQIIWHIM